MPARAPRGPWPKSNVASLDEGPQEARAQAAARSARVARAPAAAHRRALPAGHAGRLRLPGLRAALREIGQDVSEVLDYEPGSFHVVRHVRPKLACSGCKTITQAQHRAARWSACMAGAGLLAHVLVSKYADHTPLYRQCQIYAARASMLERSTLTDWVGQAARLLTPLAQAIGRYVLRPTRSTATTRRSACSAARAARRRRAGCGSMCATTAPAAQGAAGGVVPILGRPQGRAPGAAPEELQRHPAGRRVRRLQRPVRRREGAHHRSWMLEPRATQAVGHPRASSTSCPARWRTRPCSASARSSRSRPRSGQVGAAAKANAADCGRGPVLKELQPG
jgi:transposase